MTLPVFESFTDTNGTALQTHNSDWTINTGAFDIQSNAVQPNSGAAESMAHWSGDTFDDDQYACATITSLASYVYNGVALRVAASVHSGYEYASDYDDGSYFGKFVNGSYTQFASTTSFSIGNVIKLTAEGTTITAWIGDVEQHNQTDSSHSSGSAGISGYGDGATPLDNWEGGDLGIFFIDSNTNTASSTNKITLTLPTHQENDLLIAIVGRGENGSAENWNDDGAGSNGWTRLVNNYTSPGRDIESAVFYKLAGSSESNPEFTHGGSYDLGGIIAGYRGINTTTPFDVSYNNSNHHSSETDAPDPTPPAITTANDRSLVVVMSFANYGDISAIGAPTNYTLRDSVISTNENVMLATREIASAGTEMPGSWNNTYSASDNEAHSYTLALRSAYIGADEQSVIPLVMAHRRSQRAS